MSIIDQIYVIPDENISAVKDINVFQTITSVVFDVTPNTNVININKIVSSPTPVIPNLQQVTDVGAITTNTITANSFIKTEGQVSQFLKADGSVDNNIYLTSADLPSTLELFATTSASDVSGYSVLVRNITDSRFNIVAVNVPTGAITTQNMLVGSLITDSNIISGNPGIFDITTIGNIHRISGTGQAEFYFRVYKRNLAGTETFVTQSNITLPVLNSGYAEFSATALWNDGVFLETDRVVIKYYANRVVTSPVGSNPSFEFQFGGISPIRSSAAIPVSVIPNIYLKDLADVEDVSPINNEILYWNDTASLWEHSLAENLVPDSSATQKGLVTTTEQTLAGAKTLSTAPILSSLVASQILSLDGSKNIQSLSVATYPSLTELSYGKGVTSNIQTQLANKATDNLVVHLAGVEIITGQKTFNPSVTASGAIAKGTIINPTLVASANNDVLVGLDIAPTFTNGTFTGVIKNGIRLNADLGQSDYAIRLGSTASNYGLISSTGPIALQAQNANVFYATTISTDIIARGNSSNIAFYLGNGGTNIGRFFGTTGNLLLQNGGTFTDDGVNRLQVTGSIKSTSVNGATAAEMAYLSGTTSAIQTQLNNKTTNVIIVTSGTYFTTPSTITTATIFIIELVGAGGGAGGAGASGTTSSGGGGGGGGYVYIKLSGLTASTTYTCNIGVGGTGGTGANNGIAGTSTTLTIGATTYTASGGGSGSFGIGSSGGVGGTGTNGNINITGQNGQDSPAAASSAVLPALGGSSPKGWGIGGSSVTSPKVGSAGTGYGGGGASTKSSTVISGEGTQGIIYCQYFN